MANRPSWDEYFLGQVTAIGTRSTCSRGRSGCLIVRDNQLLSSGYVGSPPGFPHCDDVGHLFEDWNGERHCIRTVHAEMNAIASAARRGVAIEGCTVYCQMEPCWMCARMIIAVGAVRVVTWKLYQAGEMGRIALHSAGIQLDVISAVEQEYE